MMQLHRDVHMLARCLVIAITLAGCAAPRIVNIVDAPLKASRLDVTDDEVKQAIVRAGEALGWTMRVETLRKLVGVLTVRDETASVAIDYNTKMYSIKYRDSTNLGYKWKPISDYGGTIAISGTEQGEIQKQYNDWVKKLDAAIKQEIARI